MERTLKKFKLKKKLKKRWNTKAKLKFAKRYRNEIDSVPVLNTTKNWIRDQSWKMLQPKDHIYRKNAIMSAPLLYLSPMVYSIYLKGILVGVDKIGHFFDGGWALFTRRHKKYHSLKKVLKWNVMMETLFGGITSGIFSNGDLIANYEGLLFFESLIFGDDPIVILKDNQLFQTRKIDLRDHINPYWNEAIYPSKFRKRLKRNLLPDLAERCVDFEENPQFYELPKNEATLLEKYKDIGLKPQLDLRLQAICNRSS